MSYLAAIDSARAAWAGGSALANGATLAAFRAAVADAVAEAPLEERGRWNAVATFTAAAARLRAEIDVGVLMRPRREAIERRLMLLQQHIASAIEEGGAPAPAVTNVETACSVPWAVADRSRPCGEAAHVIVADDTGSEAPMCEAHWRAALQQSGGKLRAVRFVERAEARRA